MDDKSSSINCDIQCNIQVQFNYIQIKNAIELCDNISDDASKVISIDKICFYVILCNNLTFKGDF